MSDSECSLLDRLVGLGPFKTIVADPPWKQPMTGRRARPKGGPPPELPYPTMTLDAIKAMPVGSMAADGCHLWLWTTNAFLRDGFDVMAAWGFRYLAPIHWIKPSGIGNWFVHRTQTLLFGYRKPCRMGRGRYSPNIIETGDPARHSEKPEDAFTLIESVSTGPRLELFARRQRPGWTCWGNEVETANKHFRCSTKEMQ
jgi:N6-adenosine-specific RNA methylase IME4